MPQTMSQPTSFQQSPAPGQPQYEITTEDRARQQRIASAWQAYDGELDPPLTKMQGQPDDNVLANHCSPIVNAGVNFLFGKELEISAEEDAPAEAQTILDAIWGEKEERIPLLQRLAMNGAMAGRAFLRIVPGRNGIRLVVVDPSIVSVQTAPQDCETVLLYCLEYATSEKHNGHPAKVSYREEIKRMDPYADDDTNGYADVNPDGIDPDVTWEIQHWSRVGDHGPWKAAGTPISWPYPFPPLFSCQNLPRPNDFWGTPDIGPDIIGLNNALNLTLSNAVRDGKMNAQPIIYATGTGEQVIDIRPGKIIGLPLSESKIVAVDIKAAIPDLLAIAADLRSDIDEVSGIPGVATGRISSMPRGNLSGIAIELLFEPQMKKTEKKKMLYGSLIIRLSKALLALNNLSDKIMITLAFQNPLPHDDLPAVQAAIAKKEVGISDTTLQRELGYDPDEELLLTQEEAKQKLQAAQDALAASPFPNALPGTPLLPGQVEQPPVASATPPTGGPKV